VILLSCIGIIIYEEQLISKNIKYSVYSGIDFYSRKEIKDILSYLRFILYEKDIDFQRIINVPSRGIGNKTLEYLTRYSQENNCSLYTSLKKCLKNGLLKHSKASQFVNIIEQLQAICDKISILDLVNEVLNRTCYQEELNKHNEQERIENIEELKHGIIEFQKTDIEENTLKEYLDKISLYTNNDRTSKEDAVKLMTIHSAKGLEFKNVFIIRINDGILPSEKVKSAEGIEEERRLFYVAITRAKDKLYLTETRLNYNEFDNIPSRFLIELDKNELDIVSDESRDRIATKQDNTIKTHLNNNFKFSVGDKIRHFAFGDGIIQDIDFENRIYVIKFNKLDTLRNISVNIKLDKIE
jgi:DNA helicase-2/ATP-dependent DNA helicase PcrA